MDEKLSITNAAGNLTNGVARTGALLVIAMAAGCSTLTSFSGTKSVAEKELPFGNPEKIATFWKEEIVQAPGKKPVRGLSGRIYFHDQQGELVKVDGELTVFGYDGSIEKTGPEADRKYVFPADKFADRYSPSEIGHAYAIWIPWQPVDEPRKSISLIPVFRTSDNKVIMGTESRVALRGPAPPETQAVAAAIDYQSTRPSGQPDQSDQLEYSPPNRRAVESIPIPTDLATRLSKVPTNRIPSGVPANRIPAVDPRLDQMDSQTHNPNGMGFNQMAVRRQTLKPGAGNLNDLQLKTMQQHNSASPPSPVQRPYSTPPQFHQPSDRSQTHSDSQRPVFGKPGVFR